jgi:glucose-6-phosphate isomerase
LSYAEVCEVLVGTAHFLLQTLDPSGPTADAVFYIEAKAGDKVIIPPGFDHLTINPGPEPLLFADVISLEVFGVYDRFRAVRGGAYLEISGENGLAQFTPNPFYRAVVPLQKIESGDYPELHLTRAEPLYTAFVQEKAENWGFLTNPGYFWSTFPDLKQQYGRRA